MAAGAATARTDSDSFSLSRAQSLTEKSGPRTIHSSSRLPEFNATRVGNDALEVSRTNSKEAGSDPNHCRAFLDGYLEIVGHPHREFRQSKALSHSAQTPEKWACMFRAFNRGRDSHE